MNEKIIFKQENKDHREVGKEIVVTQEVLSHVQKGIETLPDSDEYKQEILKNLRLATEELDIYRSF